MRNQYECVVSREIVFLPDSYISDQYHFTMVAKLLKELIIIILNKAYIHYRTYILNVFFWGGSYDRTSWPFDAKSNKQSNQVSWNEI